MDSAGGDGILHSCLECFHLLHLDVTGMKGLGPETHPIKSGQGLSPNYLLINQRSFIPPSVLLQSLINDY